MILSPELIVLIPAAGRGLRSGLLYPKSLYKIYNKSIITRILELFKNYNLKYKIVINPKDISSFKKETKKFNKKIEYLFQNKPLGMGDAVLKIKNSKDYSKIKNILLIWGDIPFIQKSTINKLINFHFKNNNDFTLVSANVSKPYTLIKRNNENKIISVIEMKNVKKKPKTGEREVGVFLFKKKYVISALSQIKKINNSKFTKENEFGFLQSIGFLYKKLLKIESLEITNIRETKSLNFLSELK